MQRFNLQTENASDLTAGQIGLTIEGLGWAVILAQHGVRMFCSDPDEEIVNGILDGVMPGEMPGLAENTKIAVESGNLKLLGNSRRIFKDCRVIFINSILPLGEDHLPKLRFIETIIRQAAYQVPEDTILIIRTLLPGKTILHLQQQADAITTDREEKPKISLCLMPDYRLAGDWLKQTEHTHLLTVGCTDNLPEDLHNILLQLPGAKKRIKICTIEEAALSAYGYNGLAALRQTYLEELKHLCIKNAADPQKVLSLIDHLPGSDPKFDNLGASYGGTICAERLQSLISLGDLSGAPMSLCESTIKSKERYTKALIARLKKSLRPKGKKLAVLGLAPFGDTDDLRSTPALEVVRSLLNAGADIQLFMPCGINQAKWRFYKEREHILFCKTLTKATRGADAILILGKWQKMRPLFTKKLSKKMRGNLVVDIVGGLKAEQVEKLGLKYMN